MPRKKYQKKGGPGGRPTKYTPELLEKARYYADNWKELGEVVPLLASFELYLDISTDTLLDWEMDPEKAEFSEITSRIRKAQHIALVKGGLSNEFNPKIAALMLSKHGYSDKKVVKHEGSRENPVRMEHATTYEEAEAAYKAMLDTTDGTGV